MKKHHTTKTGISNYTDNNELNSRIYQILQSFQNCQAHCHEKVKRKSNEISNRVQEICEELQAEKHHKQTVLKIWGNLRKEKFLPCETNVIFSCVYITLLFSEKENASVKFFLNDIKQRLDNDYFVVFEPIITGHLTHIITTNNNFDFLKKVADKISNLNERKLLYIKCIAYYKEKQHDGNILLQMTDEVDSINQEIELSPIEKSECDIAETNNIAIACTKVRAIALSEFLKEMGIDRGLHDLTKICKFIAFVTGNSNRRIYDDFQKGVVLSEFHSKPIREINKIFDDLKISISIKMNELY